MKVGKLPWIKQNDVFFAIFREKEVKIR